MKTKGCSIFGCVRPHLARMLCATHYGQMKRKGRLEEFSNAKRGKVRAWVENHKDWSEKEDCLLWPFSSKVAGYGVAEIEGVLQYVHRYYCGQLNGPAPSAQHNALHSCNKGKLGCVNPHHTYWGTQKQNAADRTLHGTENVGTRNGNASLTEEDVRRIRRLLKKHSRSEVVKMTGATYHVVTDLATGKTYRNVE